MTPLTATRRLVAAAMRGERVEESLAREAMAELERHARAEVVVAAPVDEQPVQPRLAVTTDEVLAALVPLFGLVESMLVDLRDKMGERLIISPYAANTFIIAHHVLKKAGHEPIKHRKVEPLRFIPVTT